MTPESKFLKLHAIVLNILLILCCIFYSRIITLTLLQFVRDVSRTRVSFNVIHMFWIPISKFSARSEKPGLSISSPASYGEWAYSNMQDRAGAKL